MDATIVDTLQLPGRPVASGFEHALSRGDAARAQSSVVDQPAFNGPREASCGIDSDKINAIESNLAEWLGCMDSDRRKKDWKQRQKEFGSGVIAEYSRSGGTRPSRSGNPSRGSARSSVRCG
jgi:hypothetical protein